MIRDRHDSECFPPWKGQPCLTVARKLETLCLWLKTWLRFTSCRGYRLTASHVCHGRLYSVKLLLTALIFSQKSPHSLLIWVVCELTDKRMWGCEFAYFNWVISRCCWFTRNGNLYKRNWSRLGITELGWDYGWLRAGSFQTYNGLVYIHANFSCTRCLNPRSFCRDKLI